MIDRLFDAHKNRLAEALAVCNGTTFDAELLSLKALLGAVEGGMVGPFEAAGLRPEIAELMARAYSFGWADGISRHLGVTLADAAIGAFYASKRISPSSHSSHARLPSLKPGRPVNFRSDTCADLVRIR